MRHRQRPQSVTSSRPSLSERQRSQQRRYFTVMGVCLALFVTAWGVVRLYSTGWAVAMSVVAMLLPPIAAIVGNNKDD